jgi:hypothetical protein
MMLVRLRVPVSFSISLATFATACAAPNPPEVIPASLYQPVRRDSTDEPSPRWWTAIPDAVSRAAAMPVLSSVALLPGARELRMTAAVSGMIWQPVPLLRLVEWHDGVAGELYLYWHRLRDSTGREPSPGWVERRRSGCREVRQTSGWATCRIQPRPASSWRAVADSMDALKVWELPPGNLLERIGSNRSDQDAVFAELLIGTEYRRFRYYDLDRLSGADVPRLRAAARLVEELVPDP